MVDWRQHLRASLSPGRAGSLMRPTPPAPICIAGMHRSGTSMVARLLNLCGLDLGPEEDLMPPGVGNEPGHWENLSFVRLNDAILTRSGGGWDFPPAPSIGWASSPELALERAEAGALLESFRRREPWGWKDPRNSLTLPFWRPLIPDLKVVICVRDPLEVADSLYHRGESSSAFSLQLWLLYNQS